MAGRKVYWVEKVACREAALKAFGFSSGACVDNPTLLRRSPAGDFSSAERNPEVRARKDGILVSSFLSWRGRKGRPGRASGARVGRGREREKPSKEGTKTPVN
ncbi:hypothetical protein KM043_005989 [Ampulex compressa]|nr:hypothetical protein KM043_005989 [Ampulex compressa]